MFIVPEGKLLAWLERAGHDHLLAGFAVPEEVVRRLREEAQRTHAQDSAADREAWVLYSAATLTHPKSPSKPAASQAPGIPRQETPSKQMLFWLRIIAALIAGLLLATVVKGQRLPARPYNFKGYFTVPQIPHDPLLLEVKEEGTRLVIRQGGLISLDCVGAGISCTFSGNTVTFSVGGGGTTHNILSATHTDSLAGTAVLGDIIHANVTPAWARLAGNITTTKQYLSQTGTGAVSAVPAWAQVAFVDLGGTATAGQVPNLESLNGTLDVPSGGTGAAPGAGDQVLVSDSTSAATWRAVPDCTDAAGNHLNYTLASNLFSCGTSSSGGGTHEILSATHTDTTAASVARGAGMFGVGATPKWTLVNTTTTDRYFKRNSSGDIVESSLPASGTGTPTDCSNQVVTDITLNADAAPTQTCTTLTSAFLPASVVYDTATVTRDFPLNCTNPRVKSLAGNAFFDVEGLTTADVDLTLAKFLNNVDGAITCSGFVPNELAATPAAKVIFDALPHVACGAATVFRFNIRYRFWGATTTDTALTAETEQSISGSTTAHSVTRATFPSAGSLANAPTAGDNVVVEIKRVGSSASDTCEQTGEVIPTSVKLRVDVKVKN